MRFVAPRHMCVASYREFMIMIMRAKFNFVLTNGATAAPITFSAIRNEQKLRIIIINRLEMDALIYDIDLVSTIIDINYSHLLFFKYCALLLYLWPFFSLFNDCI